MKRIFLFLLTNIAVMVTISIMTQLLGVNKFLTANGLNLPMLLAFSAVVGFAGAFISLMMSKMMAKWSMGLKIINQPQNQEEQWLVNTVAQLSQRAGIAMPEVAIYEGEPNAFATGPSRNNSLVAVSTGLLYTMTPKEVEGVLAHEVAHIQNGDMVTMTLVQGVVNTFVVFLSRVVAFAVDKAFSKGENDGVSWIYIAVSMVCEILFGILASIIVMYVSRHREFKADRGAATLMGTPSPMIAALQRLKELQTGGLPNNIATSGIASKKKSGFLQLFTSHPPLEDRIEALQKNTY
jgi:heat shock protein HtpX